MGELLPDSVLSASEVSNNSTAQIPVIHVNPPSKEENSSDSSTVAMPPISTRVGPARGPNGLLIKDSPASARARAQETIVTTNFSSSKDNMFSAGCCGPGANPHGYDEHINVEEEIY